MNVAAQVEQSSRTLGGLVKRQATRLAQECAEMGIAPEAAQLVVMWGGGKDSTLALILTKAVSCQIGCSVRAVTMMHPGLSPGTVANIRHLVSVLNVEHEWRQFLRVAPARDAGADQWLRLYRRLARATEFHPRFMCVGCNLGSVVTEFGALSEAEAHFCVTGNPQTELQEFGGWATALKQQFSRRVSFPATTGRALVDYYRVWWAIYRELLVELNKLGDESGGLSRTDLAASEYLYRLPSETSVVASARVFSVLEDAELSYVPSEYGVLLSAFGWRLPEDILGGTESDCMMPAAIAALDIQHHGLVKYIEHLDETAQVLKPLPEMYDRAKSWARNGRSVIEGNKLLRLIGVPNELERRVTEGTPVAMALVRQLLPVR